MLQGKTISRFLIRYVFRPDFTYLVYFLFVAAFGFSGSQSLLLYGMFFPWLLILILFINLPFFRMGIELSMMSEKVKVNHVLEHGTIYFLLKRLKRKRGVGGHSKEDGFRVYGAVASANDIRAAFEDFKSHLENGHSKAVISNMCGSFRPVAQGVGVVFLTVTFCVFILSTPSFEQAGVILLGNALAYLVLKYPLARYFQRKVVMSFDFRNPRIDSITKTRKKGLFERNPVYFVKTSVEYS